MPPKSANKSPKSKALATNISSSTMEELQQVMSDKLSYLTEKIESMEATLLEVKLEKESLLNKVLEQANEIAELRNNLNEREQYARSWSMRCLNIPVPGDSESDTRMVMQMVYDSLLYPILEGARTKGVISEVPDCEALLETAHILPGKGQGAKPVIARFFSRYWRNLVFRHRKEFAPREQAPATSNTRSNTGKTTARMMYPFFEDLTRATFAKLKAFKMHEDVTSAWTVNGNIRFKVKDNETVFRVSNLAETVEDIVK